MFQGLERGCNTGGSGGLPHLFAADLIEVRKRIGPVEILFLDSSSTSRIFCRNPRKVEVEIHFLDSSRGNLHHPTFTWRFPNWVMGGPSIPTSRHLEAFSKGLVLLGKSSPETWVFTIFYVVVSGEHVPTNPTNPIKIGLLMTLWWQITF